MSKVVAFDIDGTLGGRDEAMAAYRQLQDREGVTLGIVTARSQGGMEEFIEDNSLQTDFAEAGKVKITTLRDVKDEFRADKHIYIGNTLRDMFASDLARWEFVHAHNASDVV